MTKLPTGSILSDDLTLPRLFEARVAASRASNAYRFRAGAGWRPVSWSDFFDRVQETALALTMLGIEAEEPVVIVGDTRPEWCLCDLAVLGLGAHTLGLPPLSAPSQIEAAITRTGARFVIVQDLAQLEKLRLVRQRLERIERIILWTGFDGLQGEREMTLYQLNRMGQQATRAHREHFTELKSAVRPDQIANLYLTSGATGEPRVVALTHANVIAALQSLGRLELFQPGDHTVSFLPMCDAAERIISFYNRIATGIPTTFARSSSTIFEDLRSIRPTVFGATPRFFEQARDLMMQRTDASNVVIRAAHGWSRDALDEVARLKAQGSPVPPLLGSWFKVIDRLHLRKLRDVLGGRIRCAIVGTAPSGRDLVEFFWAHGIPLYELYGLAESSAVGTANRPGQVRPGSAGKPAPGIEVSIAEDGEVLLRGRHAQTRYLQSTQVTAAATDPDGWVHTADVGRLDSDGFLFLTDRKSNLITLADGRVIAPRSIQQLLRREPLIQQVFLVGDDRPHLTSLILLDPARVRKLAEKLGLSEIDLDLCHADPAVIDHVAGIVGRANEELSEAEKIRAFRILPRGPTAELIELAPYRKARRAVVLANFSTLVEEMYA